MTDATGSADQQAGDDAPAPQPGLGTMIRSAWPLYTVGIFLIVMVVVVLKAIGLDAGGELPDDTFSDAKLVDGDLISARLAWGTSLVLMIAATVVLIVVTMTAIRWSLTGDRQHLRRKAGIVVMLGTFLPAALVLVYLLAWGSPLWLPQLVQGGLSKVTLAAGSTAVDMAPGLNAIVLLDLSLVIAACVFLYVPATSDAMSLPELLARHRRLRLVMAAGAMCLVASVAEVYLLYALPTPLAADDATKDSLQKVATTVATTIGICYSVYLLMLYWIVSMPLIERMREQAPRAFASSRRGRARRADRQSDADGAGGDTAAAPIALTAEESATHDHFAPVQSLVRLLILLTPALAGILKAGVDLL